MQIVGRTRYWHSAVLTVLLLSSQARCAQAVESISTFVDALCERGYFDTAVDYLASLEHSSTVSSEQKQTLLYQQTTVLVRQADTTNDVGVKAQLYSDAASKLKKFLASKPPADFVALASGRLATMEVEKARNLLASALGVPKESRGKKLADARKAFEQSREQLKTAEKQFETEIEKLPKLFAPGEQEKQQHKNEMAADLAEVRLTSASIDYELAKSYEPGSEDANRYLKLAADKFGKLYEDYRTRGAGLFAHLWEGRCYQELGDMKRALGCYQDLVDLPAKNSQVRTVRNKALRQSLECWLRPEEKKHEEAVTRGDQWVSEADRLSSYDSDGLAIRYFTAEAHHRIMTGLGPKDPERRKQQQAAVRLARQVSKYPGDYKDKAAKLVVALGGAKEKDPDAEPTTFAEARDRAREALERMQNAKTGREIAQQSGDQAQVEVFGKQEVQEKSEAARLFRVALTCDPGKATAEDLNAVRYYNCFFEWDSHRYLDAAVLGEYLATNFPKSAEGRQGARIALAAWVRMYAESQATDKQFEIDHINHIAEYIIKTWPDQDEAGEAALTLINFALQQQKTDKVLEILARIPAESSKRGEAELRVGQALWSNYLRAARLPADERPPQADLDNDKAKAAETLEQGINRMAAAGVPSSTLVAAVLSLAQIYVDTGRPEKAIERLEDAKMGPLTLLKSGSNLVITSPNMPTEIYKLALRAYVAVQPQRLDDAEKVMDALEKAVNDSGDAKAGETLTVIYITLGRELQQQLEVLRKSKNTDQLKAVSQGFEQFLSRISSREKGNTWSSLNWVAETFYSLGVGFDDGKVGLAAQAKRYYEQAIKAYEHVLARAAKDPAFAPNPDSLTNTKLRLAVSLRRIGRYDEAIKLITEVLTQRNVLLPAQVLAAETYQAKGAADKEAYAKAIFGAEKGKDGQNVVWGWSKIATMTMRDKKYLDTFYLARLQMAECRYRHGMATEDKEKRRKTLDAARQDLWFTYNLYPNLGGPARTEEYNRLLKQIQTTLGDKSIGLEEFHQKSAVENEKKK
jgi:tetratricopeptide (TPR) repeat protein